MPRLIWSARAIRDLDRLRRFLASKDADAASRAIATIREGVAILRCHPGIGRPVEGLPVEFREWPMRFGGGGYVARYRFERDEIVILGVRHMREGGD